MRASALLLITFAIFAAWYLFLLPSKERAPRYDFLPGERLAFTGLLAATQIVLTQTILGALGVLQLPALIAANLAPALALAGVALRRGVSLPEAAGAAGLRAVATPATAALLALAAFLTAWMAVAAWLLPPRGADDLVYHLPPLYEIVQTGAIRLLPLELRDQFAMPMGGDFLALWVLVFLHADTWVDLVQYAVALYGVVVLHALARSFDVPARDAAFVALLFLFTPVVMGQSGSAYTDLTLAVCHLLLALAVTRFWQTGAVLPLAMAGLAAGFGLATKYNMLVPIAAALPVVALRLRRDGDGRRALRTAAAAIAAAIPLPAYWLVRNALVTGHPLHPYVLSLTGLHGDRQFLMRVAEFTREESYGSALAGLVDDPARFLLFQLQDPGLGSLNGGLGAVFWALGVPALAWVSWRALRAARPAGNRDWFPLLFWGQLVLLVGTYWLQTDVTRLRLNQRLILVVAAFGLLALAKALPRLADAGRLATGAVRAFAVAAAAISVAQLANYTLPAFQIRDAVAAREAGAGTSEFAGLGHSFGELPLLSAAWDPLDFLSREEGWSVYLAAPWNNYLTAPLYGSRLQNRVWNFAPDPAAPPDALFFHRAADGSFEPWYLGATITASQARADARYEAVVVTPTTGLYVLRARLDAPGMRARLAEFRRREALR